jgi:hypothetical protein
MTSLEREKSKPSGILCQVRDNRRTIVVPAKAGTQSNPAGAVVVWMPAYAGMTDEKMAMVGKLFVASAGEHGMVEVLERQDGR